jgi:hypothetical protein
MKNAKATGHVTDMNGVSQRIGVRSKNHLQTLLIPHPFQSRAEVNIHRREHLCAVNICHVGFRMRLFHVREKNQMLKLTFFAILRVMECQYVTASLHCIEREM